VFDPGQGLPMFSAAELSEFVRLADYVAVNDYEGKMLEDKTGLSLDKIAQGVKALILTLGSQGSVVIAAGKRHEIPIVKATEVLDPTGCGDAYRAGLLFGISNGWDWPSTGRLGALLGSIKIERRGAQNHRFSVQEIKDRFKAEFGYSPW
jgi:adenosine kinase